MRKSIRILIGSDGPRTLELFSGLVQKQSGVVVGMAENVPIAIALAKTLRPDVVILDCRLPYPPAMKHVAVTQSGGMDAARSIADELPLARVLLVSSSGSAAVDSLYHPGDAAFLLRDTVPATVLTLPTLSDIVLGNENLKFTRVLSSIPAPVSRLSRVIEPFIMVGVLGLFFGIMMMVTVLLLLPGILAATIGGVSLSIGLLGGFLVHKKVHPDIDNDFSF